MLKLSVLFVFFTSFVTSKIYDLNNVLSSIKFQFFDSNVSFYGVSMDFHSIYCIGLQSEYINLTLSNRSRNIYLQARNASIECYGNWAYETEYMLLPDNDGAMNISAYRSSMDLNIYTEKVERVYTIRDMGCGSDVTIKYLDVISGGLGELLIETYYTVVFGYIKSFIEELICYSITDLFSILLNDAFRNLTMVMDESLYEQTNIYHENEHISLPDKAYLSLLENKQLIDIAFYEENNAKQIPMGDLNNTVHTLNRFLYQSYNYYYIDVIVHLMNITILTNNEITVFKPTIISPTELSFQFYADQLSVQSVIDVKYITTVNLSDYITVDSTFSNITGTIRGTTAVLDDIMSMRVE